MPADAVLEHFDVLFGAVAKRLRLAAEDVRTEEAFATAKAEALQRLRSTVLECVEALEQLQETQRHARISGDESRARVERSWFVRSDSR